MLRPKVEMSSAVALAVVVGVLAPLLGALLGTSIAAVWNSLTAIKKGQERLMSTIAHLERRLGYSVARFEDRLDRIGRGR